MAYQTRLDHLIEQIGENTKFSVTHYVTDYIYFYGYKNEVSEKFLDTLGKKRIFLIEGGTEVNTSTNFAEGIIDIFIYDDY